ncbi:MAG: PTS mannose transporter subunit IID [Synergistaceae bacterium]|jgi:dihydroxyacetone kinase phosphotransfer subunit|nr:PTS mannose transporter subunit IID [Synergistaceae bacterium]
MIGILVVSHSEDAAKGIKDIAVGMSGAGDSVLIEGVGGNDSGGLGVSVGKIFDALSAMLPKTEGVLVVPDLGSSILSSRSAIELLPPEDSSRVVMADAPVLEGAMMAAVEASGGSDLAAVADSAMDARNLQKCDH